MYTVFLLKRTLKQTIAFSTYQAKVISWAHRIVHCNIYTLNLPGPVTSGWRPTRVTTKQLSASFWQAVTERQANDLGPCEPPQYVRLRQHPSAPQPANRVSVQPGFVYRDDGVSREILFRLEPVYAHVVQSLDWCTSWTIHVTNELCIVWMYCKRLFVKVLLRATACLGQRGVAYLIFFSRQSKKRPAASYTPPKWSSMKVK